MGETQNNVDRPGRSRRGAGLHCSPTASKAHLSFPVNRSDGSRPSRWTAATEPRLPPTAVPAGFGKKVRPWSQSPAADNYPHDMVGGAGYARPEGPGSRLRLRVSGWGRIASASGLRKSPLRDVVISEAPRCCAGRSTTRSRPHADARRPGGRGLDHPRELGAFSRSEQRPVVATTSAGNCSPPQRTPLAEVG